MKYLFHIKADMNKKTGIILVDDHELVRDGIRALLAGCDSIQILAEASSVGELMDELETITPAVIVLDISLPDMSGIEAIGLIAVRSPSSKVLMLSMYTGEEFVISAIRAGAHGYLPKNTTRIELIDAIHKLSLGEEYFGDAVSGVLRKALMRKIEDSELSLNATASLSSREVEVLKLFCEGMSNQEIADKLFISVRTVESHKTHIMQKLGIKNNVEMIKYAIKNKIIDI